MTATPTSSTARRRGSRTAGSRTSTSCSRARAKPPGSRGLSAFVVDADTAGLEIAERIDLIAPHPLATLRLRDCRVPASHRLGASGDGFKLAMRSLDVFRASVAAAALGLARRALDEALDHATSRSMFGGTLADFQLTQAALAEMATGIDASALLTYRAAWQRDVENEPTTREAAMAKLTATETAQRVIDRTVQLHGALRRHARHDRRAAVPRDPRAAHLRGRKRSAAAHHRAGNARAPP